jgi:hypothetical protein
MAGPRFMEETGNLQQKMSPRTNRRRSSTTNRTCLERSRTRKAKIRRPETASAAQRAGSGCLAMTPMPSPINALAPAESQAQIRHFRELGALAMETHPFTRLFYADYRTTSSRPCGWLDSF